MNRKSTNGKRQALGACAIALSGPLIEEKFVVLDNGNEIRSMTLSPVPLMISSVAKRVHKR